MIRKRIALFFVLFATTLLLAHAVVPHHHHKLHICLATHPCESDSHAPHHGMPESGHHHDGQNDAEFCVLKQVVFIPSSQGNPFIKHWFSSDNPIFFVDWQAETVDNKWITDLPVIVLSGHVFQKHAVLPGFIASCPGLRAPPLA